MHILFLESHVLLASCLVKCCLQKTKRIIDLTFKAGKHATGLLVFVSKSSIVKQERKEILAQGAHMVFHDDVDGSEFT